MEEKSVGAEIKKCETCGRDATTVIMSGQAGEASQYTYYCRRCNPNIGANPLKFTLPYKCAESAQEHEAQVDKALARAGFQEVAVNEDGSRKYIQNELVGAMCEEHKLGYVRTGGPISEAIKLFDEERERAMNGEYENAKRKHQAGYPDPHGVSVKKHDPVNHPSHYCAHPSGVECITITEHYNFCLGSAMKYIWRAGMKESRLQDLEKAQWYIAREIQRLKAAGVRE